LNKFDYRPPVPNFVENCCVGFKLKREDGYNPSITRLFYVLCIKRFRNQPLPRLCRCNIHH